MLSWALIFLTLALVSVALDFGGLAGAAAGTAKIVSYVVQVLLVISGLMSALRGRPPV